jgi:hypothetical protein
VSAYRQAVGAALEALQIDSPTSFTWCGEPSPPLPAEVVREIGEDGARAYLCDRLQACLYSNFYCPGRVMPTEPLPVEVRPHGASPFIDSLSRANSGTGSREAGWRIVREEDDGRLVVRRHGLSLWARPDEIGEGGTEVGSEVSLKLPPELLRLSPGFYMALGDEQLHPEEDLVRHYWHLGSSGATALVAAGTRELNEAGLPFRLKVVIDPAGYGRCDAGVLYTPRRLRREVGALLPSLRAEVAGHLRAGTPALTKPLAEGLALAEDPPGGESFGMHRCSLLAQAATRGFERGAGGAAERLSLVERHFEEHGISFDRPYLNPGSADEYELAA